MIRKIILLLSITLISILSFSQEILTENQKLASLCRVWGFLKYHHPAVVKGTIDWDQQLVKFIPAVISAKDQQELSRLCQGKEQKWHGSYYPDGRETQRMGIVPDIKVSQTIVGIRNRKDDILDRAMQFLSIGQ